MIRIITSTGFWALKLPRALKVQLSVAEMAGSWELGEAKMRGSMMLPEDTCCSPVNSAVSIKATDRAKIAKDIKRLLFFSTSLRSPRQASATMIKVPIYHLQNPTISHCVAGGAVLHGKVFLSSALVTSSDDLRQNS